MKVLMYNFRWQNDYSCDFEFSVGDEFMRKKIGIGDQISLKVCSDLRCAGSIFEHEYEPCLHGVVGKAKCWDCKEREKTAIYTYFNGFNNNIFSDDDFEKLKHEHVVYLAYYGNGVVKVGVSKSERRIIRQTEQGAQYTLFIAKTPDGVLARKIETLLSKSGVPERIDPQLKRELLLSTGSVKEGERFLRNLMVEKGAFLDEHKILRRFLIPPCFIDWTRIYGLRNVYYNKKTVYAFDLQVGESVSGKIVAIKGYFVFIETPKEIVAVCFRYLLGREVDLGGRPVGLVLNKRLERDGENY